ncbi:hypothetical protein ES708_25216 [subsurface metagenome]
MNARGLKLIKGGVYEPPVFKHSPLALVPPQTSILVSVQTAVCPILAEGTLSGIVANQRLFGC